MNIHADKDYWINLKWPAAPNQTDYSIFEQYCSGSVLLLGSTKLLLPLCTEAWDLEPKYADAKIKNRDWFTIDQYWDTIIVDGALAFGEEYAKKLISAVLPYCTKFVARVFLNPNWPTKYACYYPQAKELAPQPIEHPVNNIYTFYIWEK